MLVHVRLTVPASLSVRVRDLLLEEDAVTNLTVQPGAVLKPEGDLLECDVARESASALLAALDGLGVGEEGGIVVTTPSHTPFKMAHELEARIPGHPDDAVIWDAVEDQAHSGATPTLSFHVFLVIAVALAAVALINDSSVLVVGAMAVGPEFGVVAAMSAGVVLGNRRLIGASLRLLVFSFLFAIVVVAVLAFGARLAGLISAADVTRPRPLTAFVWHPDGWSVVVAMLAGAAGALALAIERSSVMVGVFISVTTVPAAGNLALALAVADGGEIGGSVTQLGLNLAGMVVSGSLTLLLVRTSWPWLVARSERIFGQRA